MSKTDPLPPDGLAVIFGQKGVSFSLWATLYVLTAWTGASFVLARLSPWKRRKRRGEAATLLAFFNFHISRSRKSPEGPCIGRPYGVPSVKAHRILIFSQSNLHSICGQVLDLETVLSEVPVVSGSDYLGSLFCQTRPMNNRKA